MQKVNILSLIFLLSAITVTMTYADSDGELVYSTNGCATCHGPKGEKSPVPVSPKLAGQDKASLLQAMTDMKNGTRTQGMASVMQPGLRKMSAADLEAVSEWLSQLQ